MSSTIPVRTIPVRTIPVRTIPVRRMLAAGALATLALAAACDDDDPTGPNGAIVESIETDAHVMAAMHESNVGEIAAGQVALQKGQDQQVRGFAQMMIADHTTLDAQGTALAAQLGVTPALPDQRLPELQAQELQTLNATAAGVAFDRVYIAQQITAHERTLELIDRGLEVATRGEIRTLLQLARPSVAAHLQLARNIQQDVGVP